LVNSRVSSRNIREYQSTALVHKGSIRVQSRRNRTESLFRKLTSRLVLQTLRPLVKTDPTRQTFRLISGTLVKRTVTDVVPALETTLSGITEVLESLVKSYKTKETDFVGFQKEYGIQVSSTLPLFDAIRGRD